MDLVERTLSGLDERNAVLRVRLRLVEAVDLRAQLLADGETGSVVSRAVDPQTRGQTLKARRHAALRAREVAVRVESVDVGVDLKTHGDSPSWNGGPVSPSVASPRVASCDGTPSRLVPRLSAETDPDTTLIGRGGVALRNPAADFRPCRALTSRKASRPVSHPGRRASRLTNQPCAGTRTWPGRFSVRATHPISVMTYCCTTPVQAPAAAVFCTMSVSALSETVHSAFLIV